MEEGGRDIYVKDMSWKFHLKEQFVRFQMDMSKDLEHNLAEF